ncbi:hypothetical protein [Tomitella cavernea]|uniref:hypothetical protein n=1 Tax=Tomitella cavernea TaxID=1387982 RepID=UPI001907D2EA|nr:hypothetical protein [Tomitella cavernea]
MVGDDCPRFCASTLEGGDACVVRQEPRDGVILQINGAPAFRLEVEFTCVLDGHADYLAVQKSSIKVFVAPAGKQPLFRYEYERTVRSAIAGAHIQFHGQHPELESAMQNTGSSTTRSRRRADGKKPMELSALHFPVGGPRFRPCLEDVMEMLIDEFGVQPVGSISAARATLASGRETWRRKQVATVVRDAPDVAVQALKKLGFHVEPPAGGHPPGKSVVLQSL